MTRPMVQSPDRPIQVQIGHFPLLRALCWGLPAGTVLAGDDVLDIYERGGHMLRHADMSAVEVKLVLTLATAYGSTIIDGDLTTSPEHADT